MNLFMKNNLMFPTMFTIANSMPFSHRYVSVKFGPGILDARGSIGGVTFSKNSTSHYMRSRVKPVNPNTERQDDVRSGVAEATTRWSQTLNNASRILWNEYAAGVTMPNVLGEAVHISGFNHYIRSNAFRISLGFAAIDAAPAIMEIPAQDPSLAIAPSAGAQQLNVSFDDTMDWANETGGVLFVHQGKPQNPQRFFFGGPYRWCTCVGGDDVTPPVTPEPAPAVFHITELQKQWIYCRIQRADGRLSEPFRAEEFVGA